VPREQLVRPGQRRSLMRRALVGIVPDQLLSRKRKAFVARAPLLAISTCSAILMQMTKHMVSNSLSIVKSERFCEALENIRQEQKVPIIALMRTIGIERWLLGLRRHKLLDGIALDVF
ncbi:MAG: asparagine synthase-related protein, partial [Candidatus Acidiferrales bacterium]